MKKRKALMTLVFVGATSLPFLVSAAALPAKQNRPNRVAFERVLESGDYTTFKNFVSSTELSLEDPFITEEIYKKLVEANKLRKAGDKEGAEKIMTELGLKKPPHAHMEKFFNKLTVEQKQTLKQARLLSDTGKVEEAKTLLVSAGIKIPEHKGPFIAEVHSTFKNLTQIQKTAMQQASVFIKAGKMTEARALLEVVAL